MTSRSFLVVYTTFPGMPGYMLLHNIKIVSIYILSKKMNTLWMIYLRMLILYALNVDTGITSTIHIPISLYNTDIHRSGSIHKSVLQQRMIGTRKYRYWYNIGSRGF